MKNKKLRWLVKTAAIIALVVLSQLLTKAVPAKALGPFRLNLFVADTLSNLIIVAGAFLAGMGSAASSSVIAPVIAAICGVAVSGRPQMVPAEIAGYLVIAFVAWLCFRASHGLSKGGARVLRLLGVVAGAGLKAAVMWGVTEKFILPLIGKSLEASLKAAVTTPQAFAGAAGGILALLILAASGKIAKHRR